MSKDSLDAEKLDDEKEVEFATATATEVGIEIETEAGTAVREVDPWRRWRFSSCR